MKKVLACLDSLGGLCQAKGVAVPAFGKNKCRDEQARVGGGQRKAQLASDAGTMLMRGSAGTMERSAASNAGITFGSGSGAGTAGALLSSGSRASWKRA
ncbi:hypothetical protein JL722_13521 [Aureococcus anophagefferens]|nr:hypothetical protein JL722_13521 [Aureococcus anophagefferens]